MTTAFLRMPFKEGTMSMLALTCVVGLALENGMGYN
jgi:hypothetical protein